VMLSLIYFLMLDFDLEEPTPINPLRCISEKKEQGIMSKKKEEPTRISNTEVFIPPKSTATFDPFSPGRMEGSLVGRAVTDRSTESPILGQEGKSRNCVSERGKYVSFCFWYLIEVGCFLLSDKGSFEILIGGAGGKSFSLAWSVCWQPSVLSSALLSHL